MITLLVTISPCRCTGTFSGTLIDGSGVLVQALKDAGYKVIDAEDIE